MNAREQPASDRWAALTFRGETLAAVWFKPDGDPLAVAFRVPRATFDRPGVGGRLTPESLLKTVGVAAGEVEAWDGGGDPAGLSAPLPPPEPGSPHRDFIVRLKPPALPSVPAPADDRPAADGPSAAITDWQDLDAVWTSLLTVEAGVEAARKSVESARAEVEGQVRRTMTADEKVHALAGDVAQWTRAKGRAQFVIPRANEFIHRATWAAAVPERKTLGELFETPAAARPADLRREDVLRELEALRKSRQVLASTGTAVYQDCRAVAQDIQGAFRTLQSNASSRAAKKKGGRGKSF